MAQIAPLIFGRVSKATNLGPNASLLTPSGTRKEVSNASPSRFERTHARSIHIFDSNELLGIPGIIYFGEEEARKSPAARELGAYALHFMHGSGKVNCRSCREEKFEVIFF